MYFDKVFGFYEYFFFYPSLLLSWVFELDCFDTYGELEQGYRRQGRPCKRLKDTVKAGLQWCDIPPTELVATALDIQCWRTKLTQSASSAIEEERRHQAHITLCQIIYYVHSIGIHWTMLCYVNDIISDCILSDHIIPYDIISHHIL